MLFYFFYMCYNYIMNRIELLQKVKNELPESSGVYIMKNEDDEVIYVGKAKSLKRRVKSYFDDSQKTQKTYLLVEKVHHFDYILTNNELDAFSLESNLIKKYKPKYNILLKDDKSFPYLKIDYNERFPRLQIVRRPKGQPNTLLFGPYVTGTRISDLLSIIKSAYPIRWCNKNFDKNTILTRPCLHGEIGNCLAPCCSAENEELYMRTLDKVVDFLNGKTSDIKKQLKKKMDNFASQLKFEEALVLRNQLKIVESLDAELITSLAKESDIDIFAIAEFEDAFAINVMIIRKGKNVGQVNYPLINVVGEKNEILMSFISNYYDNAAVLPKEIVIKDFDSQKQEMLQVFLLSNFSKAIKITVPKIGIKVEFLKNCEKNAVDYLMHNKERIEKHQKMTIDALEKLKNILNLTRLNRIECFDISHISGQFAVASMVVFENGEPAYKEYRKFKIKTVDGNDDYASMREVLMRRISNLLEYKENFSKKPDLLLIDGGFGQLNIAKQVQSELGTDIDMISLAEKNEEICTLQSKMPIVLKKNDYALKLLQRIRDEAHRFAITYHRELRGKSLKSSLLEIEGLGEVKVKALLKKFKSAENVARASESDLAKTEGIGEVLAHIIFEYFHKDIIK